MINKKYALLLMLTINTVTWANDETMLVGVCSGCHGPLGASLGPATPTIAGFDEESFVEIMVEYKNGDRPSTIMGRIAKGYTDDEILQMANYFAKQPFVRQPQAVDAEKAKKGAKLHQDYCEKCHEDNGHSNEDGVAILAGQKMPYLQFSLTDFQSGVRDMPRKMKKRIRKMIEDKGEESLNDIVHFYGSQTDK